MAAILQKANWNPFCLEKMFVFWCKCPIGYKSQFVRVKAWRQTSDKPLLESMLTLFYDVVCGHQGTINLKPHRCFAKDEQFVLHWTQNIEYTWLIPSKFPKKMHYHFTLHMTDILVEKWLVSGTNVSGAPSNAPRFHEISSSILNDVIRLPKGNLKSLIARTINTAHPDFVVSIAPAGFLGPLLLTWFNSNPSMDK